MPPPISHETIQNKVTNTSHNSHVSMAEGKLITSLSEDNNTNLEAQSILEIAA
jgi:hypothetical protein